MVSREMERVVGNDRIFDTRILEQLEPRVRREVSMTAYVHDAWYLGAAHQAQMLHMTPSGAQTHCSACIAHFVLGLYMRLGFR